jgi:ribosomal protein S17E
MLFDYQELDIVGNNWSVKKPSELGLDQEYNVTFSDDYTSNKRCLKKVVMR